MDLLLNFDGLTLSGDLAMDGPDLAVDQGFRTAILVSFFTDRRAHDDDVLPDDGAPGEDPAPRDPRGWWGDWYPDGTSRTAPAGVSTPPARRLGSRFWLLQREVITPALLPRIKDMCLEALDWMTDPEGPVAASVDVTVEIVAPNTVGFQVDITRSGGAVESHRFDKLWSQS